MYARLTSVLFAAFLTVQAAFADDSSDLKATVLEHDVSFSLSSPVSGEYKVHVRTLVHKKDGLSVAAFSVYTDSFRSLTSFSGKIEVGGKVIRKLKMSDVVTVSLSSGLADDSYASFFEPNAPCPCIIEYEYTVSHKKGIASFPVFAPVDSPYVSLKSARYELRVPRGQKIQYEASAEPEKLLDKNVDVYVWNVKDYPGYVTEHLGPPAHESVPYVYSGPVDFSYAGTSGSLASWKDMGLWLYGLQKDVMTVPQEMRDKVLELTEGVTDDVAKIRILYDFLRRHTRYVSIQLGIGGLKPFPAETVWKNGFGDCKALSIFMQAMLDVVGIPSDYIIVHTSKPKLMKNFHSPGQMNHAMLRVPVANDTLWLECTNPRLPLGYRHSSIAGHEVVVVKPDGGELVKVPSYPDSLRFRSESVDVVLSADGSASCTCTRRVMLDRAESYIGFSERKENSQFDALMSGHSLNPSDFRINSVRDNFDSYVSPPFIPEAVISYSFNTREYAKVSGDRMFFDVNPFAKSLYSERGERRNRVVIRQGSTYSDTVRVVIPEGYTVEAIPSSVTSDTEFGKLDTSVSVEGTSINVVQTIYLKSGNFPKEAYESYRAFARNVSKNYSARVVLKKTE